MKINAGSDARGVRANAPKKRAGETNGAGFANHLGQSTAAAQAESASGAGSVAALLAVQAAGDALEGRRQAFDRAENLLKQLDALRLALLDGRMDNAALKRIADEISNQPMPTDDPMLAELVAEIELRAQVELAKRGLN